MCTSGMINSRALSGRALESGRGYMREMRGTPLHLVPASSAVKSNMAANVEFQVI